MDVMEQYEATGYILKDRILEAIPKNPEILQMTDPWDLFHIPGFNSADLQPSLAQACWALAKAKEEYKPIPKYRSIDDE